MEGREREPKGPYAFHAVRVKHLPERTAESNKHRDYSKDVKAKKVIDSDGSGVYTPKHHLLIPSQYIRGGPRV